MADPIKPTDRESAVSEWEKQNHTSLVSPSKNSKLTGLGLAAATVMALGAVFWLKHSPTTSRDNSPENREVEIAERKPVPKLPEEQTPAPQPVHAQTPAEISNQSMDSAKQQRLEFERKMREARMKSALLAQVSNSNAAGGSTEAVSSSPDNKASLFGATQPNGAQDANSKFSRAVSGQGVPVSTAKTIDHLEYKILQGKLIEAVLEPRAISDLPGMICATVQRDVYAAKGREKLIPWGSRVCGVYSGDLRKGQERLFVVWNTLRRPDGVEVTLDSIGSDQLGSAGMGGNVNNHFGQIFGMSALLSIIGAGVSTAGVNSNDQYNSEAYYRQAVQQATAQTAQQVLQPYVNIPPTVTVPAGSKIRIYVNRDLDFSGIYQKKITQSQGPDYIF